MLVLEQVMEIKILDRQGKSLRQIASEVGLSVNTVRKYLKHEGEVRYSRGVKKEQKLDSYKEYLSNRVSQARPLVIPATVLLREIKELGYKGEITQLRLYLRQLKPVGAVEEVVRFETLPGRQMQVDWAEVRKGKDFLAAFVATMGFSRASYVKFVNNERLESLLECHKEAFEYFGGVPYEVLYDNMRTVIIERDAYGLGKHRFNSGMLDFARHYGFRIKVCRPFRAKTKGKVERFIRYLRESFYNPLASKLKVAGLSLDLDTANAEVLGWLRDVANKRVHGTTGQVPEAKLKEETPYLQTLPTLYSGDVKAAKVSAEKAVPEHISKIKIEHQTLSVLPLQHPLSVYQQILEAL